MSFYLRGRIPGLGNVIVLLYPSELCSPRQRQLAAKVTRV